MKTDALTPIEGKILVGRGSANKIGMIAGIAPPFNTSTSLSAGFDFAQCRLRAQHDNYLDLIEANGFDRRNFSDYI
jgi:hypothetical protein